MANLLPFLKLPVLAARTSVQQSASMIAEWLEVKDRRQSHRLVSGEWPRDPPSVLPPGTSPFVGVEVGSDIFPAMLLTRNNLQAYRSAFLERQAAFRAHAVNQDRVQECSTMIDAAGHDSRAVGDELDRLLKLVGDNPDPEDQMGTVVNQINNLESQLKRTEKYREDLANERLMLAISMLTKHMRVWDRQVEADQALVGQFEQDGLLRESPIDLLKVWNELPIGYREGTFLQPKVAHLDGPGSIEHFSANGRFLSRDEASLLSALMHREVAEEWLNHVQKAADREYAYQQVRENEYTRARVAGHQVLTPSEFAREGLRRNAPYLHRVVAAENKLRLASERLQPWRTIGELHSKELYALREQAIANEENFLDPPILVTPELINWSRAKINAWLSKIDLLVEPTPEASVESCSTSAESRVDIDDSNTMKERRKYEQVRAREWSNLQTLEAERLRSAITRVPMPSDLLLEEIDSRSDTEASALT